MQTVYEYYYMGIPLSDLLDLEINYLQRTIQIGSAKPRELVWRSIMFRDYNAGLSDIDFFLKT